MRRLLVVAVIAFAAGCGDEAEQESALRQCGGSFGNVIAWTEATPDVHCPEALAFADHVVGYTVAPSPCFRGGEYGGAVTSPCDVNGWRCEIGDEGQPPRAVFDCTDEDRDRRLRLVSLYALHERPESWDETDESFDSDERVIAYRRLHLACREYPLAELAAAYETDVDRDAVLSTVAGFADGDEDVRGCKDGFRARDLLGRFDKGYLDSSW